ncbi:hypothetical protein PRO82_000153 [Candidatus Protochlamydia amoebophila]|nr:hypothetical protein [Candidatus Protochlamydia amoebophila]
MKNSNSIDISTIQTHIKKIAIICEQKYCRLFWLLKKYPTIFI